ncbi:MAG: hypothetical protein JO336_14255 [Acidobacteriia bacterium]|nr:hypothetical protein [Terriglobia bacterium]MBV8902712.1 hypothetical protein [Terriglobia bacterium]
MTTPGRRFYNEQIALLQQGRTDDLIDRHYHQNASLVSFANVVRGHVGLKEYFRAYMTKLGKLEILSLDQFMETDDSIFFEATVRTAIGESKVYDAFVLRDGKATHHFTGVK